MGRLWVIACSLQLRASYRHTPVPASAQGRPRGCIAPGGMARNQAADGA
jgi:hypothetical protein